MAEHERLAALWQSHISAGVKSQDKGRYVRAEKQFRAAVACAEQLQSEPWRLGQSLTHLAEAFRLQGKFQQAGPLYVESLTILQELKPPATGVFAFALRGIASLRKEQGLLEEAWHYYILALATVDTSEDRHDPSTAPSLRGLGEVCRAWGVYGGAAAFCIEALRVAETAGHREDIFASHIALASIFSAVGDNEAAKALCQRAIDSVAGQLGPEHPLLAEAMDALGSAYAAQGEWSEAAACFRRALHLMKLQASPKRSQLGLILSHVADSLIAQGRLSEAEALYSSALQAQRILGPEHPEALATLEKLGAVCIMRGEYRRADTFLRQAQAGRKTPPYYWTAGCEDEYRASRIGWLDSPADLEQAREELCLTSKKQDN
ncbi:MAG: tetratricopeptide repeat protein [Chloroflexi bacterium]|nr:tetratricopeptide repeat protein [Chloroflexota bacterium]